MTEVTQQCVNAWAITTTEVGLHGNLSLSLSLFVTEATQQRVSAWAFRTTSVGLHGRDVQCTRSYKQHVDHAICLTQYSHSRDTASPDRGRVTAALIIDGRS